jgi:hypothetical protein
LPGNSEVDEGYMWLDLDYESNKVGYLVVISALSWLNNCCTNTYSDADTIFAAITLKAIAW